MSRKLARGNYMKNIRKVWIKSTQVMSYGSLTKKQQKTGCVYIYIYIYVEKSVKKKQNKTATGQTSLKKPQNFVKNVL